MDWHECSADFLFTELGRLEVYSINWVWGEGVACD